MSVTVTIFGELCLDLMTALLEYNHSRDACEKLWGEELKDLVEDRGRRGLFHVFISVLIVLYSSSGVGPLVVRPDSGDPPTCVLRVLNILGNYTRPHSIQNILSIVM